MKIPSLYTHTNANGKQSEVSLSTKHMVTSKKKNLFFILFYFNFFLYEIKSPSTSVV